MISLLACVDGGVVCVPVVVVAAPIVGLILICRAIKKHVEETTE